VLLGGDAGLRCGEIQALEWNHVDLDRRQLRVEAAEWRGPIQGKVSTHTTAPKGGRGRIVPMTTRLAEALKAHRHLQGPRVLYRAGRSLTRNDVQKLVRKVARRAHLAREGVHVLRHRSARSSP